MASRTFNGINNRQSWQDKVVEADALWAQVKSALEAAGRNLPATPRRPDVRLIVDNISGATLTFQNPGNHAGGKPEVIPAAGDSTAVMIMPKGATLQEQRDNAARLDSLFHLSRDGLTQSFIEAMASGALKDLIDEAYGPAPFQAQAARLADLDWTQADGARVQIPAVTGKAAAYGARPATQETVFLAQFHIYVKGSGTTPELVESSGMNIAVSTDGSGKATTRPIVPSVARSYYGAAAAQIPVAIVHPDGQVKSIALAQGDIVMCADRARPARLKKDKSPKPGA